MRARLRGTWASLRFRGCSLPARICSAPKAPPHIKPGESPQEIQSQREKALKARLNLNGLFSIHNELMQGMNRAFSACAAVYMYPGALPPG
jgi:hypothetical protein